MSDMIDNSKGFDAIAYAASGGIPWHGKGEPILPTDTADDIVVKAGLGYTVKAGAVQYAVSESEVVEFTGRNVLYRDDTGFPLGILSKGYKIFQPRQVVDFQKAIVEKFGATFEVVGALDGGRRVWSLSKLAKGSDILDGDIVEPYLLAATSYDGSMSNTFKLTGVRVVCHNTITAAVGYKGEGQAEADRDGAIIRIPHTEVVDIDRVRVDLGITFDAWERFVFVQRKLARTVVSNEFVGKFLKALLPKAEDNKPVEGTRAYQTIEALYQGEGIGADLASSSGTAFGLLNAVTQFVDHTRGTDGKRLNSAWFGTGDGLKAKAMYLLEDALDKGQL